MKQINYWSRRLYRRAKQQVCSRIYINPDPDVRNSIVVAGTARSGTTWLGDLIASQISCRTMFEPFNPDLVPEYRRFNYFQYMQPGVENQDFHTFVSKVMTGKIRNRWIDRQNEQIIPKYRLIKEIRANLSLKWIQENFPEVPILLIMRHPCAVVLSRMQLGWATDTDIHHFLVQQSLVDDHLADYVELIKSAATEEEKHAIIWGVTNLVPLKQFQPGELKIIYYENLIAQPEPELTTIFNAIHQKYQPSIIKTANQPSLTAKAASASVTGKNRIADWQNKLSTKQIDHILEVVKSFGLDHLYGDSHMPLKASTIPANRFSS